MVCRYVHVTCSRCGKQMCTATHPAKKIGFGEISGTMCVDDVPDCPIYDEAVVVEQRWIGELEGKGVDVSKWKAFHGL